MYEHENKAAVKLTKQTMRDFLEYLGLSEWDHLLLITLAIILRGRQQRPSFFKFYSPAFSFGFYENRMSAVHPPHLLIPELWVESQLISFKSFIYLIFC